MSNNKKTGKVGLVELLTGIGNDNLYYQSIDNSIVKFKHNKKHNDCEVTFCTAQSNLIEDMFGMVIWVKREDVAAAVELIKASGADHE